MAHKKSLFILVLAFTLMALVTSGCERSYASVDENQPLATPTLEGEGFPDALPADMEGVFEAGAQTATAQALAGVAGADAATAVPEVVEAETEASPEADTGTEAPTEEPAAAETEPSVVATNTPVPAPATAIPSVDTSNLPSTYTLQKGEFPYCIARRFNVNPNELLSASGISSANASALQPGLTLTIPKTGKAFPYNRARNAHPVTYVVPETTNVYEIACFFGDVDPAQIVAMNGISNSDVIAAGTSLQIP